MPSDENGRVIAFCSAQHATVFVLEGGPASAELGVSAAAVVDGFEEND